MDDTTTTETPAAETAPIRAKKVKRIAGKIAQNDDPAIARKRRGKLAIAILRDIANGKTKNPQAVAKAFFKGTRQAKKDAQTDGTEDTATE